MDPDAPLDTPSPRQWCRRAFVKGCVLASATGLAAAAGGGVVSTLDLGLGPMRRVDYLGATVASGPAPQGVPLIPLAVGDDGVLRGRPEVPGLGSVLDWYRYCGHENSPALRRAQMDERLRYQVAPGKLDGIAALAEAGSPDAGWYLPLLGQDARPEHFAARGFGAPLVWRGEATAVVLRLASAALRIPRDVERVVREGFLLPLAGGDVLLAYSTFCKHFCCVPGWHETSRAARFEAADKLHCTCHDSVFDPLEVRPDFFVLREP